MVRKIKSRILITGWLNVPTGINMGVCKVTRKAAVLSCMNANSVMAGRKVITTFSCIKPDSATKAKNANINTLTALSGILSKIRNKK